MSVESVMGRLRAQISLPVSELSRDVQSLSRPSPSVSDIPGVICCGCRIGYWFDEGLNHCVCPLPSVHGLGVGIVLHRIGQATTMLVEGTV